MDQERESPLNRPATDGADQGGAGDEGKAPRFRRWLGGLIARKWFFPALYLAAAAFILSFIFWYQSTKPYTMDKDQGLPAVSDREPQAVLEVPAADDVPVTKAKTPIWPVAQGTPVKIVRPFYNDEASAEERARALVEVAQSYYPNTGIDLAVDGKTPFDVVAVMDGTVTRADVDPVVGGVVWVDHGDGTRTTYASLGAIRVKEGDAVRQGDVLGTAGTSPMGKDLGLHLHFEVLRDGRPVDPLTVLPSQN